MLYQQQVRHSHEVLGPDDEHPNYDQFWKERNIFPNLKNIHAAVMTVGGWYDNEDLFGALDDLIRTSRSRIPGIFNVLVMGPWFHGGWARSDGDWLGTAYFGMKTGVYYREHFELPFFNHFLKDKGEISEIKEVNVFDTGANEWTEFANWSPTTSTDTPIYLHARTASWHSASGVCRRPASEPGGALRTPGTTNTSATRWNPVPYTQKDHAQLSRAIS